MMKKVPVVLFILLLYIGFPTSLFAQPANDTCAAAIPITVTAGSCNSILYTNVAATSVGDPATPACWAPNSINNSVWFSFVATTPDVEISTNFGGTLANTQLAVYSGTCGALSLLACQEDINTAAGLYHTDAILHGLTVGNTYYLLVDGNGASTGTFGICVQQALPIGPTLPIQDCVTSETLCSLSTIAVPDGTGGVGVNQENPSCFGTPGERSSSWYTFTAGTSGTLAFIITPTANIDYDFAVFNTTTACPGTEITCNWSGFTGVDGSTGLGCTDIQCNPTIAVTAGQTYTILIDRFTASSSAGFTLDFTGSTFTVASPTPSFTATTACLGTATQFTNTTNGNYSYNWSFGDGFTSTAQNPNHTYAAAGTYTVTLVITALPGGCQNAITQMVTVNPVPLVDAGVAGSICSGGCITLGGSTNAIGSVAPVSFSNTTSYVIPDDDTNGVYSPITVNGISPATISSTSIASVCLNLTHAWDEDLDVFLQCPDGTRIQLSTDNGSSFDNYTNTCFTPTAPTSITSGTPPFSGVYLPEDSFTLLNGCTANGTWQLFVRDDAAFISGFITDWSITFNSNIAPFSWSPVTSMTNATTLTPIVCPTTTTTYTLTANNGIGCTATDTVTVNVSPKVTPTFTQRAPICAGALLSPLPTTSLNGITGTWSPSLNNNTTLTYTFTPTAGLCATTTTMTIVVNPIVTPTFTSIGPICSGTVLLPLPPTSLNGITGTWSPALNNSTTTTYTFTPTAGQCATTTTLTITVTPTVVPTFNSVAPICAGGVLSLLPTASLNGVTGSWTPALDNSATTTYTFTPTAGICATSPTLTIIVNPNIAPTFTAVAPICSGATLTALPTTSTNGYTGTWVPALNNTATTTYTFTPAAGQCTMSTTLSIVVNPNPMISGSLTFCNGSSSQLTGTGTPASVLPWASSSPGVASVSVTGLVTGLTNGTTTITYTDSNGCTATALVTIATNITPTFSAVAPICAGSTLAPLPTTSTNNINGAWTPALDTTTTTTYTFTPSAGQCAATTTMTITVNPNVVITFNPIAPICSGSSLSPLPTTSTNGYSGTWTPAIDNTATTTYTFTPSGGQCATLTTLTITVNQKVVPTFSTVNAVCNGGPITALPTTSTNGINGTWNPPLDNTTTTTYTFTPTVGQCATTNTINITVTPNITPTFSAINPICAGDTISALPTTSMNGYAGTWAPALDNSTTTTYTFTPSNTGLCLIPATLTITVNPNILPTFSAVNPICSGGTLAALPTTSTNGYVGVWSPALNNIATTTYTFTPTGSQCATAANLTISITPNSTPTFTPVAPICIGSALASLPTTSLDGFTGTWSPALNNMATTTYTFTPTAGQCALSNVVTVTVNALPSLTGSLTFCNGSTSQLVGSGLPSLINPWVSSDPTVATVDNTGLVTGLSNGTTTISYTDINGCTTSKTVTIATTIAPVFSAVSPICSGGVLSALPTTSNNSITGIWSPALDNTATTTYTFTPTPGQCATTTTLTITVNPNITPTFAAVSPICVGGTLAPLPNTSINGYSGLWLPALNNTATTTYTFTPAAGQCATAATLVVTVTPNLTPTFPPVAPICSGGTLAPLPTTSNNGFTGTWTPAINNLATTTYTFTPAAGQCATTKNLSITVKPNNTPTFTAVAPICSGGTLLPLPTTSINNYTGTWSPALDNTTTTTYTFTPTAGLCATLATLTLTVNPNINPTFSPVAPICSGGLLAPLPTTSLNGISGSWAPALDNTVTTTYTFTPTAGQCAVTTTLTIVVTPNSTPTFTPVAPICSGTTLAALPTTSNNGYSGSWMPALDNTSSTTYTFTPTTGVCALPTTMTITVNIKPTITGTLTFCNGGTSQLVGSGVPNAVAPWTSSDTAVATVSSTGLVTGLSTGITSITYTDNKGCFVKVTVNIATNLVPTFTAVPPICNGGTLAALPTTSLNSITGSWSPALDNTTTTTYTFTPTGGQCATTATLTITVNPNILPTFTALGPICDGGTLSALPTTSLNGYTGSWSPALDNTTTTTYTFTPTAGQCAITATLTITVNPNITPTFTAIAPICDGATLNALPTTSLNGYTGTWSPALDNTATTTYTFTPTAGQCATTTMLTVTVIPNTTPTFTAVAPICPGGTLNALPTISLEGYTGSWSPALNNTTTTTYTFTPTAGQCATTATLIINVTPNTTPTFSVVSPICDGGTLTALPTTSLEGYTGVWSPALDNSTTTTYTFTPTAGQCATTTTLTITVNPNILPTFTALGPICDGGTLSALPTTSLNGYTGSWSPALDNTTTTTYTFTPTAGLCATTASLTITVNPNIIPNFSAVAPICNGATLNALPTTSLNGYTGTWSPALDNTATTTYTFTPTTGQCATTTTITISVIPNTTPTFTSVAPICPGGTLNALPTSSLEGYTGTWSPALDNMATTTYTFTPTAGQCATAATLTITVTPNTTPTFTSVSPICSGGTLNALPTTSLNGYTGIWSPALDTTATTSYTFTPTAGQCATTTTLTITVNPNILPTFTAVAPICSGGTLNALPTTSLNGYTGSWSPALDNTTTTTYTFTPTAGQCATTASLTITVNPNILPTFTAVAPICAGGTLNALPTTSLNLYTGTWSPALDTTTTTTYTFTPTAGQCATTTTLTITVNPNITPTFTAVAPICAGGSLSALPMTSLNGYTGSWSPGLDTTATTTYTFTPTAGQCATTASLTITVNPNITPTFTAIAPICAGGTLNALPTNSLNGYTGSWSPALNNTTTTNYTFTPTAGQCATTASLTITVNPNILPTFTAVAPICAGGTLSSLPTTSLNGYTGSWSPGLDNNATTTYTFTPTTGQCATTATLSITVTPIGSSSFASIAPLCEGSSLGALPTSSLEGYTGTWSPALDNTTTTTYTFTPNLGQCTTATTLTITILPNTVTLFSAVAPICSGSYLAPLPTTSANGFTGSWSPALTNTATTTYTFTPAAGQCATPATLTITVYALPQVSALPALHYCDPNNDGFGVFDLTQVIAGLSGGTPYPISFHETLTDAQINGTFIPTPAAYNNIDVNDQLIYIRVESVESADCYAVITLPLIVDPTPEAVNPTDYHLCDYTGATGQEPFDLTTKIPEILGSINPIGTQVTFYTDNTAAQNGTNVGQITNVTGYLNTSSPQIIYVRVEFTATHCYDIVPLTLIVDGLPLATQPNYPQYSLCDYTGALGFETFDLASQVDSILLGQTGMDVLFYPSLAAAQAGVVGTSITELNPSLQYVNTSAYVQTLGIRITNHLTGCYSISTMDIRVNPLPSPIPPMSSYTLCDQNQDGITEFDLTTLTADILQGANYIITYHETYLDADHSINVIADPAHYYNIFAFSQILYVRAEDPITHCYTVMPFTIAVDPSPIAPVNVPDIELCDQDSNPYNALTLINLTQNTANVLGQQPAAASGYTIEYYTSLALAQAGTAPIIPASSFVGADGQTIWVRVENNLTGCYNIGTFNLIIHTPLLLTTPPVLNMCDDDAIPNNQHTEFDLTVRDVLINQGTGYTVTYYTSSNVLITDPAHYVNGLPGAVEPITAVVTTPFGCTSSTILDIRVLPVPTPLDPSIATPELTLGVQCENATGSGVAQFDLMTNAGYIMNGDPSVTLHYFPTQADLDNNTNEILNPATAIVGDPSIAGTTVGLVQYVYIAVSSSVFSDYTGRKCYKEVKEGFVVNPLPTVAAIADFQICENDPISNNGIEVFDLTTQNAALLAGNVTTPVSNYTVAFYEDPALAIAITSPTAYSNTSNPQTIFVQITNTTTGCKSDIGSFNLVVNPKPIIATLMPDMSSCDTDGVNDGQMLFTQSGTSPLTSLGGYIEWVLGTTQTAPTYVVEFYDNQTSADAGISTNALTDLENYQVHTGTYWVRVENLVTGCYQLDSFKVTIEKLARPAITSNTGSNIACVTWGTTTVVNNLILDSGITAPNYTFNWYADGQLVAGENNSTINITNVATSATHVVYTVEAVSVNPPMLGCTSVITPASTFDVIKSGQAANLNYTVTNAFAENQVITVTNDGYGLYQYSMDDGPRQMSPIFENVSIGTHTIYVWDTLSPDGYSCGVQLIEGVETIDYPPYFTPNNDGIHDTWNIQGLQGQPYAKIFIFDRHGKLLKQLSPLTEGWDGTYNGYEMPSDDYWFTVDYLDGKFNHQFKGHFAIKR